MKQELVPPQQKRTEPVVGINIFSGADTELGAALTNPTELARQKGRLSKRYSLTFAGKLYSEVEQAYHVLATERADKHAKDRDALMIELIAAKFMQHSDLFEQVKERGGAEFLQACSHWTQARTPGSQSWEGQGLESRFIRNLVAGYCLAESGDLTQNQQRALF